MSHDLEAQWAATALSAHLLSNPADCFATPPPTGSISTFSGREGRIAWPHADGFIEITDTSVTPHRVFPIALEFKRENEGVHGTLTALGQAHAYIHKGYAGSAIVVPESYATLPAAGSYLNDVLSKVSKADGIGVFAYSAPDRLATSPFHGKLTAAKPIRLNTAYTPSYQIQAQVKVETAWAHVREGSTEPDAIYRYLQSVKLISTGIAAPQSASPPAQLIAAIGAIAPGANVDHFLSNAPNNQTPDRAWRSFWFRYVLTPGMLIGWTQDATGTYLVNDVKSLLRRIDGQGLKSFFSGRRDSIKNALVDELNASTITPADAWKRLAKNFKERAHSYREDIDSSCAHLGFVDENGLLTESGFRFVDACERHLDPNAGVPRAIFSEALLNEGGFAAFLHYIWRLSDKKFASDPFAFSNVVSGRRPTFDQGAYLSWLESELADNLRVLKRGTSRGGVARKPFQAEFSLLRSLGLVGKGFRIGVGLPITWPEIQRAMRG